MSTPTLHYSAARGLAESIRLMLTAAGVDWNEQLIKTAEDLDKLRKDGLLTYQQVPLLQWNGVNMVQSVPIIRFIARKYNLMGNAEDEYRVDMLTEGARDFNRALLEASFKCDTEHTKTTLTEKLIPRYMPVFEKALTSSTSGFLVGKTMTIADVMLFEVLLAVCEALPDSCCKEFPKCKAFYEMMKSNSRFAAYLSGPKRYGPITAEYLANARKIFNF